MISSYTSPAKINLNLRVLGKRDDGFHEVETVMSRIDLVDILRFQKSERLSLECDFPGVPLDESNLVMRAVRLLEAKSGQSFPYKIQLEKKIPHGAGLAGGSSNAATTLKALNELEQLELTQEELLEIAAKLGSDVCFFLYDAVCVCRGRGEKVTPIDLKPEGELLLLKPNFGVSTPDAYSDWAESKEIQGVSYAPQLLDWGEMVNDLESPVFQKHRFLAEIKLWLLSQDGVNAAMMSGSGSTIFALVNGDAKSLQKRALEELDPTLWSYLGNCLL